MDAMQISAGFTDINQMQSLQSIQNNTGVTGSTGDFFSSFIQTLLAGFSGTDEEKANLLAGLGAFTEENPEDNKELMDMIASMMAMGVNYNDIMNNGSFDPTSYINSAINTSNYSNMFDTQTYADLQMLSSNTGTDMSVLTNMLNSHDPQDGALLMQLAMSSANTNATNASSFLGNTSSNEFDMNSYFGATTTTNSDLATQLYSANTNMTNAINQAMATTQDSTISSVSSIASVSEEPTEPDFVEDFSNITQFVPTSTQETTNVEKVQEVFVHDELDVDDLNMQISKGIENGDITDTKEMVIRLRPEGLGEVTVKLVQDNNSSIKIDIVTASEQTAKLLNEKLPQLRESMRDLQTEISEVFYNDNQGNPEQNAKDQAAWWAYNQEQRDQREAFNLDEFEELVANEIDEISEYEDSKIYI